MTIRLGVDLGGTKIEIVALDDAGAVRLRERVPTPRGDYAATLDAVAALVAKAERTLDARGTVGIGIPGALSRVTGLVKNANSTWLIGKPLQQDLERALVAFKKIGEKYGILGLDKKGIIAKYGV